MLQSKNLGKKWYTNGLNFECGRNFVFLIATKLCSRDPRYGFKIACGVFICVGILNLLLVNLRWYKWAAVLKVQRVSLAQINWLIIGVVAVLVLAALIADWRHKKMRKIDRTSKVDD